MKNKIVVKGLKPTVSLTKLRFGICMNMKNKTVVDGLKPTVSPLGYNLAKKKIGVDCFLVEVDYYFILVLTTISYTFLLVYIIYKKKVFFGE